VTVGSLRAEDLGAALALSAEEGWNQTATDWRRLLQLDPAGCFAARDAERLVGTVTTATYGGTIAWIGMMVIHPEYRRRGLGAALMQAALERAHARGITRVKLDATPAGRPLYESLGFSAEVGIERWQGIAAPSVGANPELVRASRDAVLDLDRTAFGADRSALLDLLLRDSSGEPLVVRGESGATAGYALARRGRVATYVGPIVATTAIAAQVLLDGLLARLVGEEVCLDLHRGGLLEPAALAERGLTKRRGLVRMAHGLPSEAGASGFICASAGPELG
jgi:GNAT superfamily N-acetyltransferase